MFEEALSQHSKLLTKSGFAFRANSRCWREKSVESWFVNFSSDHIFTAKKKLEIVP